MLYLLIALPYCDDPRDAEKKTRHTEPSQVVISDLMDFAFSMLAVS